MDMNDSLKFESFAINSAQIKEITASDEINERSRLDMKPRKKQQMTMASKILAINYQGITIFDAAASGNLPICVLLWGMAAAKKISLMIANSEGNNPFHCSCEAETTEVLNFLYNQTGGFFLPNISLITCRNNQGETPLFVSLSIGKIPVIKALLDLKSDPFIFDNSGNSIFIKLIYHKKLWALNFVYNYLRRKYSSQAVQDLLFTCNRSQQNVMSIAASVGDINIIEFLVRRGVHLHRTDGRSRTPLHWAVECQQVNVIKVLLAAGCDPHSLDDLGESPIVIAKRSNVKRVMKMLLSSSQCTPKPLSSMTVSLSLPTSKANKLDITSSATRSQTSSSSPQSLRSVGGMTISPDPQSPLSSSSSSSPPPLDQHHHDLEGGNISSPSSGTIGGDLPSTHNISNSNSPSQNIEYNFDSTISEKNALCLYKVITSTRDSNRRDSSPTFRSHTIYRNEPSRHLITIGIAVLVCGHWYLLVVLPWWACLLLGLFLGYLLRNMLRNTKSEKINTNKKMSSSNHLIKKETTSYRSQLWKIIKSTVNVPENFLGVWLGSLLTVVFYLMYSIAMSYEGDSSTLSTSINLISLWPIAPPSASETTIRSSHSISSSNSIIIIPLFWLSIILLCLLVIIWSILVWSSEEVCLIDTRYRDFEKILLLHDTDKIESSIPSYYYCRTTMIIKPLRSKYCTQSGHVVPRMDHYCVWLNRAIGYGNHRIFLSFIITHWIVNVLLSILLISSLVRLVIGDDNKEKSLDTCSVLSTLFSSQGLLPLVLGIFIVYMTISLSTLIMEQLTNIISNQTTNERINGGRYPWFCDGNRFDRGIWRNIREFLQLPPCHINYHKVYDMPPPPPPRITSQQEVPTESDRCLMLRNFFSYFHKNITSTRNNTTSNSHFQIILNSVQNALFDSNLVDTPTHD